MPRIQKLSTLEIQKIAAGEVVERPANVVKELIENALDAHATAICIYLEETGRKLIRVVDNGYGMDTIDARTCFEHHATSKISSVHDLDRIESFGFRGEALSSIAAVSTAELLTRQAQDDLGSYTQVNQGIVTQEVRSCPIGTDISIQNLFFNTPVRYKFLKGDTTEWRHIVLLFQAFCLEYVSVQFTLYHNGERIYHCPPAHTVTQRVIELFGHTGISPHLLSFAHEGLSGVLTTPTYTRYDRTTIFCFVNKRWVRNNDLIKAFIQGYANALPPQKYPFGVVQITVLPDQVDVNIHPRKQEVRFSQQRHIEKVIKETVTQCLEQSLSTRISIPEIPVYTASAQIYHKSPITSQQTMFEQSTTDSAPITQTPVSHTIVGQLHKTYILIEQADGLFLVDQHAAHERILYERCTRQFQENSATQLLFPHTITLTADDLTLIEKQLPLLHAQGIEAEVFGPQQLRILTLPVFAKDIDTTALIRECIHTAHTTSNLSSLTHALRAQIACKAAVKAGDILTHSQMQHLLITLHTTPNRLTCPHGRPTGWLLATYDIEKRFKRIT